MSEDTGCNLCRLATGRGCNCSLLSQRFPLKQFEALREHRTGASVPVVVVENASSSVVHTTTTVCEGYYVSPASSLGFASALNVGLQCVKYAHSDLLVLTPDPEAGANSDHLATRESLFTAVLTLKPYLRNCCGATGRYVDRMVLPTRVLLRRGAQRKAALQGARHLAWGFLRLARNNLLTL